MYRVHAHVCLLSMLVAFCAVPAAHAEAGARDAAAVAAAEERAEAARAAAQEATARSRDAARAGDDAADAALERELRAARERLEAAAREVATLSSRLVDDDVLRIRTGGARRAMLGVQLGETVPKGGVRVRTVSPGGPAAEAGLRGGDVIVAIDGRKVRDSRAVAERIHELSPGATTKLDVEREGKVRTYAIVTRALDPRVVLMMDPEAFERGLPLEMPEPAEAPVRFAFPGFGAWSDVEFATLTKDLGRYFGASEGVLVVRAGSNPALQLRDGDVITAIDGREPQSGAHALRILRSYQPGEKLALAVLRDRKPLKLEVTVPEGVRHGFRMSPPTPATPAAAARPASPAAPATSAAPAKPAAPSAPPSPASTPGADGAAAVG